MNADNKPVCSIALFDAAVIKDTEIFVSLDVLSWIINLGKDHSLHYISSFDLFGHVFLEKIHCEGLSGELSFLKQTVNDELINKHLEEISQVVARCIQRNDCKLLINADPK